MESEHQRFLIKFWTISLIETRLSSDRRKFQSIKRVSRRTSRRVSGEYRGEQMTNTKTYQFAHKWNQQIEPLPSLREHPPVPFELSACSAALNSLRTARKCISNSFNAWLPCSTILFDEFDVFRKQPLICLRTNLNPTIFFPIYFLPFNYKLKL